MVDWKSRIVSLPDVCHGKPCVRGTRVLVSSILGSLASGFSRDEVLARASQPSISVKTVTALARAAETVDERVQVEQVAAIGPERPGGRRFGALVHSLLATIDLDAEPAAIRAAATTSTANRPNRARSSRS